MDGLSLSLTVLATCLTVPAISPSRAERETPRPCISRIIIAGNTVTQDEVIRDALCLFSGQEFCVSELRLAEKRLAALGIFEMDEKKGIRPTVTAIPTEDPHFQDVLVQVTETHTGTLRLTAGITERGGVAIRLTVEERNFDPRRFPTCMDDLRNGRVFRGAGKKVRLDLIRITVTPR